MDVAQLGSGQLGLSVIFSLLFTIYVNGNQDAKRLYDDVLHRSGYNRLIRPRMNSTEGATVIRLGLSLSQIIAVDEKNQIITTNVWLEQEWMDYKLRWEPTRYGGIEWMYVPADDIWLPDIVLYNSADGNFTVQLKTKATVYYNGVIKWKPPAIYNSLCPINVTYFPFDVQDCHLKLGSWTYDGYMVDVRHKRLNNLESWETEISCGIDLNEYYGSTEWDILKTPAKKWFKHYPCCDEPFPDIKFRLVIRRKPLFFMINLILPCVAICSVTILTFYIPANSGEKITMGITILNSLTIFLLLVVEINPPTSLATPLIGKYLLFTMILVTCSIMVTVFVLHVHFRSPATHTMSPWTREIFLHVLPKFLLMRPPVAYPLSDPSVSPFVNEDLFTSFDDLKARCETSYDANKHRNYVGTRLMKSGKSLSVDAGRMTPKFRRKSQLPPSTIHAMVGVTYIAENLRQQDEFNRNKSDWEYMARVLDRMFLWIFTTACLLGTFGIFLQAPSLTDNTEALTRDTNRTCPNQVHVQDDYFYPP